MRSLREAIAVYRRTGSVYRRRFKTLIPLAVAVFLPLGLLDALGTRLTATSLEFDAPELVAAVLAALALGATSLLGEIFYSGAVAISLTTPAEEKPSSLRALARRIDFVRLILVDLLFVAVVVLGLALLIVPGLLAFVWFTLAGPVVEIEHRGVWSAMRRSFRLVRGHSLAVALVVFPLGLGGDMASEAVGHLVHAELGESLFGVWIAEAAANSIVTPPFAVALVLLTLDLIAAEDGGEPGLKRAPATAEMSLQ